MNKNKIISFIFILAIFYFPIHAAYSCLIAHTKLENKDKNTINWEKLYPFRQEIKTNSYIHNLLEKYNNIKSYTSKIEEKFNKYLPYRFKLSEFQMYISKLLGIKLFLQYDGLVVLNNGYLDLYKKNCSPTYAIKKTLKLYEFIKNLNTKFLFVIYPCKNSKFDNQFPKGLKDKRNLVCDEFLSVLRYNNVETLDLRENAKNSYKSQYEMFFRTDHHWKPSAGLWASKEICNYLNEKFNWEINTSLLDKEKFKNKTIPNYFLGSLGKKITLTYVKPDDFYILEPYYNTNFTRICPTWEKDLTGSFDEVMFCKKHIEKCDYYEKDPYVYFLNGGQPYLQLKNNSDYAYNKKVLLIRDSFNRVVAPFLALSLKDLTLIDIRHFKGSVKTLIEKEKYDLVIIAYYVSAISNNNILFEFD